MKSEQRGQGPYGVILCGGRGTRMGGADKGLMEIAGTAAVKIAADILMPLCDSVLINANRNLDRYRELALGPVIPDLRQNFPGPLGGLEAVTPHLHSSRVLILPCDMPRLSQSVPQMLIQALDAREPLEAVYARAGGDNHYLVAALRRSAFNALPGLLDRNQGAVRDWYKALRSDVVEFPESMTGEFDNLNDSAKAADAGLS